MKSNKTQSNKNISNYQYNSNVKIINTIYEDQDLLDYYKTIKDKSIKGEDDR